MALSCLSVPGLIASGAVALLVVVVQLADRGVRPVSRACTRGRTGGPVGISRCIVVSLITAAFGSGAVALALAGRVVPAVTGRLAYLAVRGAGVS
jgi:hypothetical protein